MYRHSYWIGLLLLLSACGSGIGKGEVGIGRHIVDMEWSGHLRTMPPIRDRVGNVYFGFRELGAVDRSACMLTDRTAGVLTPAGNGQFKALREGTRRVHGWVGFGYSDALFWSGDGLWRVGPDSDTTFTFHQVHKQEGATRPDVNFEAVVPWLWDRPARRTMLALVEVPGDALPRHAVVDVDDDLLTNLREFEPAAASNVVPMGVAGNLHERIGVMLVWYAVGDLGHVFAIFLDEHGDEMGRTEVTGLAGASDPTSGDQWQDSVVGFGAMRSNGDTAFLLESGELIFVTTESAHVATVDSMTPVGVQLWNDDLWLVGTMGSVPALADISSSGRVGTPEQWSTSLDLATKMREPIEVVSEITDPRDVVTWESPENALGPFPLVAPYSLLPYNEDAVGWIIGGPSYLDGIDLCRSVAFVPIGAGYP